MNISIDESSGFCWGVVKTIDKIEEVLKESNNEEISVLGEIIHNPREIERLEKKGLRTITHKDMPDLVGKSGKVIIRAHGEPPQTYKTAEELGLEVIDATCPLVKTLQNRIRKAFLDGYQVIIFGKKNHAEIIGIRGVCNDECIVISGLDDALELVDFTKKSMFFSQTTMDWHKFKEIQLALEEKFNGLLQEDNKFITK
ncbi:MAG: 4-hydroxy-3-methylbut-2-enyl diphosphate reductase, partial [FCB group bacterium]